jgi:hypothetical protein
MITYYLGAGASHQAIPCYAKGFRDSFIDFIKSFNDQEFLDETIDYSYHKNIQPIFSQIVRDLKRYPTPDVYAYGLYLSGRKDLLKPLKMALIYYLLKIQNKVDPRYQKLIIPAHARSAGSNKPLPNLNIISWNYDIQFELAYADLANISLEETFQRLQVYPKIFRNQYPYDAVGNAFNLVHLNGLAYCTSKNLDLFNMEIEDEANILRSLMVARSNLEGVVGGTEYLKFGFELDIENNPSIKICNEIARKTRNLIIVGYSFPDENHFIDKTIFENFKQLESIVIQDYNEEIKQRIFESLRPNIDYKNIRVIKPSESHFYVPR